MKLRTKLFLIILSTSLIPLLLFSAISIISFNSNTRKASYQIAHDKASTAQVQIDDLIKNDFTTLKLMSQQTDIRSLNIEKTKTLLVDTTKVNPDLLITLVDVNGQQIVKSNNDALQKVNDRDYFKEAIKGSEEYVSEILVSKATGHLIVFISTPVRENGTDKIVGALTASIEVAQISNFVKELSQNGSLVYVVSKDGKVLAHPNIQYATKQTDLSKLPYIKAALAGDDNTLEATNEQGQKVIASYIHDKNTSWLICVETPYNVAMGASLSLFYNLIVMLGIVLLILIALGLYISGSFTKPLVELSNVAHKIANGDLTEFKLSIETKDEIGLLAKDFRTMSYSLGQLIKRVQELATTLTLNSQQLAATTKETDLTLTQVVTTISEMAQGNISQSEMIQNLNNAISNVTSLVKEAALMTGKGAEQAKESLKLAENGQQVVELQNQKIIQNNKIAEDVAESVQELVIMTSEIQNIVGVINAIAGKTNLLALNASIEAARAGDHGRGFAVVAEEIRKLAEQSRTSTKEIETIVRKIDSKVGITVNKLADVKSIIEELCNIGVKTKISFDQIFVSVIEEVENSKQIASALIGVNSQAKHVENESSNISVVMEQASTSMQEVSTSSEEQLASIETITLMSKELLDIAQDLMSKVATFKI
ncbi:methyl-accepting chemotaxis protein [Desulfosporosinus sp. SB140]|uniref:methyl-accepting chemotaxis protein n=1 Tax=Desulfosporosinus paludis TaxID=3115649 RepID=UPI003890450E